MSLNTTLSLYNQMTPVLQSVVNSMNTVISSAYDVESATSEMLSTSSLDTANKYIQEAGAGIVELEENLRMATNEQENYNKKAKEGQSALDGILGKAKMLIGTYLGMRGVSMFTDTADEFSLMQSRLDRVNDGTRTTAELQKEVYLLAQRTRNEYGNTLDIYTKLGTQAKSAFKSNNELLAFTEQLNKNLVLAGTTTQGVQSVMYNLTQAMASGVLRGQDLKAVMENAMPIVEKIADYMGESVGNIRDLAAEGKIAASVVKEALLAVAAETNAEFAATPYTLGQAMTMIKNSFIQGLMPAFETFSEFINSDNFEQFTINVMNFGNTAAEVINNVVSGFIIGFNFIYDNSAILIPVFTEIVGVLMIWHFYTILINEEHRKMVTDFLKNPYVLAIAGALLFVSALTELLQYLGLAESQSEALEMALGGLAVIMAVVSGAFIIGQAAVHGFNVALWSNPIGAILMLLVSLVFLMYQWIKSIGGVKAAWLTLVNFVLTGYENLDLAASRGKIKFDEMMSAMIVSGKTGTMHIANAFSWLGMQVQNAFDFMESKARSSLNSIVNIVNEILGTSWKGVEELNYKATAETRQKAFEETKTNRLSDIEDLEQRFAEQNQALVRETNAKEAEYKLNQLNRQAGIASAKAETEAASIQEQPNLNDMFGTNSDIYGALNDIAGNTKDINGKIDWDNDDLSSLKDLMEQRAITDLSKEVKLEVYNEFSGAISKEVDVEKLKDEVSESIAREWEIQINAG